MDQQTPVLQKIEEAVVLIKQLQQEKDDAIGQSQILIQEKDNAVGQAQALQREKDEDQKKLGVETRAAEGLSKSEEQAISRICKRVFRVLSLSGYARMDLRMTADGRVYVLEANPNPNLSYGEDFAESAETVGIDYEALPQQILRFGLSYKSPWYG